jgi:hypothetical protein
MQKTVFFLPYYKIKQGNFLLHYSPRAPCAALAAYFLCMGLRVKKTPPIKVTILYIAVSE